MINLRRLGLALFAVLIVSGTGAASEPSPTKAQRATERLRAFMEKR